MKLCIFEDEKFDNLYPLTYLRPVFELKCGATSLEEKIIRAFPGADVCYFVREWIVESYKARANGRPVNDMAALMGDDLLMVNGRLLMKDVDLSVEGEDEVGVCGGDMAYVRMTAATAEKCKAADLGKCLAMAKEVVGTKEIEVPMINFPWDLIDNNPEMITVDFEAAGKKGIEGSFSDKATVYGDEGLVYVAPGAEIHPFVTLDTREGPVTIAEDAEVHPYTRIEGPSYIGRKTTLFGAKIREGTSIGEVCRVGGEIEESIFHSYSNKYHDGFIGHAYLCQWINLGALTSNSDLKNDYKTVELYLKGQLIDSGSTKVGSFIGDHTKTSIGTLLNTGTMVGCMSNVVGGSGILPKYIPSFVMVMNNKFYKVGFKQQAATARTAMGRRKLELGEADEALLKHIFDMTKDDRMPLIKQSRKELAQEAGLA
ncbi:MAG: hypothetical protein GXP25_05160 [Planctomycetes bacterium]|nr:hypothetical protein [Planctomycetota bacterium]